MSASQDPEAQYFLISVEEHMWRRPGMYIGGTDKAALHRLVDYEVESIRYYNHADKLVITLSDQQEVSIESNGEGLPLDLTSRNIPPIEIHRGMHWISTKTFLTFVMIYSEQMKVEVREGGYLWAQTFELAKAKTPLTQIRPLGPDETTGTTVTFRPNFNVFQQNDFDYDFLAQRFNELAGLNARLKITLQDKRTTFLQQEQTFYYEGGLADYLTHLNRNSSPLHIPIYEYAEFDTPRLENEGRIRVHVAFQYIDSNETMQLCYGNEIRNEGGTHQNGFMNALRYVLSEKAAFTFDDVKIGLTSVVSVWHPDIQFESQTKVIVLNEDIEQPVFDLTVFAIARFAERHPDQMRQIIEKCLANKRARET